MFQYIFFSILKVLQPRLTNKLSGFLSLPKVQSEVLYCSTYLRNFFSQHPPGGGQSRLRLRRVPPAGDCRVGEHVGRAEGGGGVKDAGVPRRGRRHRRDRQ